MYDTLFYNGFLGVLLAIAGIWARSSFGKLTGGKFVATLRDTLSKFASKNPYAWYKQLLEKTAIPNAQSLGFIIMWGEFFVAVSITISVLVLLIKPGNRMAGFSLLTGLIGGFLLNSNFYFASGWMNSSTESINLLMMIIEAIAIVVMSILLFAKK